MRSSSSYGIEGVEGLRVGAQGTLVVYVHGLWLRGHEAVLLRRRLGTALNARTLRFAYRSVRGGLAENVAALAEFLAVQARRVDTLHLVGHSMGGLLLLRLFDSGFGSGFEPPPGRVVLLGSPVCGSLSAQRLARLPGVGRALLGRTGHEVLLPERERRWSWAARRGWEGREVGVIAGDLGVGLGRLLGPFDGPHDGTVRVAETRLAGAQALTLAVSHSGMVFSAEVARRTAEFLRDGRFG